MTITAVLGAIFVGIELSEFRTLIGEGYGPHASGFMSAFFTLVGTHGLHVSAGLLWMVMLMWKIAKGGLQRSHMRKLMMLGMFWHFLDIIWIFIFTIVYLMHIV
jgi:cytochrome o ubiquinol oxidase subunit III